MRAVRLVVIVGIVMENMGGVNSPRTFVKGIDFKTLSEFFIAIFFFSSRRRHTRLQGDWSSDVCSSDLDLRAWHDRWYGTHNIVVSGAGDLEPERFAARVGELFANRPDEAPPERPDAPPEIGRASCRERV